MPRKAASATRTKTPTRSFSPISRLSSFIGSPRLRQRLALPHSLARLACGSGSHCLIHWLASPAAPARTATALLMRIPLAALVSRSGQEGPDRRIVSGQHRLGRAEGAEPPVDEDGHA